MANDRVIADWSETGYAAQWQQADGMSAMLRLPWAIAAALVGQQHAPSLVVDVGSGPGTFLAALLETNPEARGVWIDASPQMRPRAEETLAAYAGRVEYVVGDAADLSTMTAARDADVVLNSRVAHHFDRPGLEAFYADAAGLLTPGGWLVTLDHILPPGDWDRRYRDVLPPFAGPNAGKPSHPHYFPFPSMRDHLDALAGAGLTDADLAWRAFYTCLYVARKTD